MRSEKKAATKKSYLKTIKTKLEFKLKDIGLKILNILNILWSAS